MLRHEPGIHLSRQKKQLDSKSGRNRVDKSILAIPANSTTAQFKGKSRLH